MFHPKNDIQPQAIFSVTELNQVVRQLLERHVQTVSVTGEISNLVKAASGHFYFSLKDKGGQVACVFFKGHHHKMVAPIENGQEVLLCANATLYPQRGTYQLIVSSIEPAGLGELQRQFEALKLKLQKEGLFDAQYKKLLPNYPSHLGVITSVSGAALHDVLKVLNKRYPLLSITVFPSQVQGAFAPSQLVQALTAAEQDQSVDIILLTRGGGSMEDLWAFNDETLARAIFACQKPLVSAVGHEVDVTISDLVADVRAATPSAAAEIIVPDQQALFEQLTAYQRRLIQVMYKKIELYQYRLETLQKSLVHPKMQLLNIIQHLDSLRLGLCYAFEKQLQNKIDHLNLFTERLKLASPVNLLLKYQQSLALLEVRLHQVMQVYLEHKKQTFQSLVSILNRISPLSTLSRGYAIAKSDKTNKVIIDVSQVAQDDEIQVLIKNGKISAKVLDTLPAKA